jgi:hypothetical protein
VEWITVSYRSVGLVLLALVVTLAGSSYWYYSHAMVPKKEAERAISRASLRLAQALELPLDASAKEMVENADLQLTAAREDLVQEAYREASIAAIRSEKLSMRAVSMASGKQADGHRVQFAKIEGQVRVKQAGGFSWKDANTRMALQVGDQIKTSSNGSAEVIYFDGTVTQISPGSLLEIRDLYEDPVTKVRRVREKLTWGEVRASTEARNVNGSFHEVTTDKMRTRAVSEGEFRVAYDREKKTTVLDVFGGQVQVATDSRTENVAAGERLRANANGTLSAKELLPGVPRLLLPSDQRVFVFDDPTQEELTLRWEALPNVDRYRLMIAAKPLFTEPLYDAEREGVQAPIAGLTVGSYHWKVAALSKNGAAGPFSASRRFRVSSQQIRDRSDVDPPKLNLTEFVLIGQMVIINGTTEPDATLWVDNNKVDVYEDGTFNAVVKLRREGLNDLLIVAQDPAGNESTVARQAYVEIY